MYAEPFVLFIVVLNPRLNATPPASPLLPACPSPPRPQINPLLTKVSVSPVVPPERERPGVPVLVEYTYTPELTVTVTSDVPAAYPLILVIFSEAFVVLLVNV
jgi:hypothetical protein